MHSTKIALLLAAAIIVIGLAGCGGGDVSQFTGVNTTTASPADNPATAGTVDTQGSVTTASVYLGDMDASGTPSSGDAIKIMRIIVGLDTYTSIADVNQNGYADTGDAIKVLRCVLGLDYWPIITGPPPPPF